MGRIILIIMLASLGLSDALAGSAHWEYAGESGPSSWGTLSPEFSSCQNGKSQSPVDLKWRLPSKKEHPLKFSYKPLRYRIIDNGHTVMVNFEPGARLIAAGREYGLIQMHFHAASEHTLSGKSFPLELHLVHKDASGKLAVVGVFFKEGAAHSALARIWSGIPSKKNEEADWGAAVDPSVFLPEKHTHYHYVGSLTTPPCTEGVDWNVLNSTLTASPEQLERFKSLYAGNRRPLQPLHDRKPANY